MSEAAFIFNPNVCTRCAACVIACQIENKLPGAPAAQVVDEPKWRNLHTYNPGFTPGFPVFHLSLACNHCQSPACQSNCPASAYTKDPQTGAVLIDTHKCIGCRYCAWACPFDAPKFNSSTGTMEKCTFCNHRLQQGEQPACVKACPTNALDFEFTISDSPDLVKNVSGFPRTTLKPQIQFIPLRFALPVDSPNQDHKEEKISLTHEWPLWFLTSAIPVLFAYFIGPNLEWHAQMQFQDFIFWGLGMAAMLISTLHLGKPIRAWRAILNFRNSWLSREIGFIGLLLSSIFFMVVAPHLLQISIPTNPVMSITLWAIGVCTLFSIDRIYDLARLKSLPREDVFRAKPFWHSGSALLGGLYLAGIAVTLPQSPFLPLSQMVLSLGLMAGILQLGLYINRYRNQEITSPQQAALISTRVLGGFAFPIALIVTGGSAWVAFLLATVAYAIDRMEFYDGIEIEIPGW